MILFIKYALLVLLAAFVAGAALYSIASRRTSDVNLAGKRRSVMNILMGGMLITLALIAMFVFRGSTVSVIVEALFIVIGAFNVFSGIRSYSYYSRLTAGSRASRVK